MASNHTQQWEIPSKWAFKSKRKHLQIGQCPAGHDYQRIHQLVRMAISGTQIRGTYHTQGLFFSAKFQGISPQNIARRCQTWHPLVMTVTQLLKMDIYSILPWFYLSKIVIFHSKDRENVYHRSPEICRDAGDAASTSFHLISLLRLVVALQRQKKNTWQR